MICIIQRVSNASVTIGNKIVSSINHGLLVFLGVAKTDKEEDAKKLVEKISTLRVMDDGNGKMNRSVLDTKGEILVISQFTLCANLKGGRRPDFFPAMEPVEAKRLYELFAAELCAKKIPVKTGSFGAVMEIKLVNYGPVTFTLDSNQL